VSFDVTSLFTRVPLEDSIWILSQHVLVSVTDFIMHVLTTTYFLFSGTFYEQIDDVAMGSPTVPVTANIYMENFKQEIVKEKTNKCTTSISFFLIYSHLHVSVISFDHHQGA
jgi:hypothetical protein